MQARETAPQPLVLARQAGIEAQDVAKQQHLAPARPQVFDDVHMMRRQALLPPRQKASVEVRTFLAVARAIAIDTQALEQKFGGGWLCDADQDVDDRARGGAGNCGRADVFDMRSKR